MPCPMCRSKRCRAYHQDALRDYLQCPCCGLVFVPQSQHLDSVQEKARYDEHQNDPCDPRYREFLSKLQDRICRRLSPPASGLDFGSGPEPVLAMMFRESGYEMQIYDRYYADHPEVLRRTYDFITCNEVVEHLHEPGSILKQLVKRLRAGGLLGIRTQMVINRERFASWHYTRDPTHVAFFSRDTFCWFAEEQQCLVEFPDKDIILLSRDRPAE